MTHKQIDASREVRLWLTQVILPACGIAMMIPEARDAVVAKVRNVTWKIKLKLDK
jgi:hypothetical protein